MSNSQPVDYTETLSAVLEVNYDLGEGPIWDSASQRLVFVDCHRGHIHHFSPQTGAHDSIEVGQTIGAALPRKDGGLVATSQDGLLFVREGHAPELIAPIETDRPNNRMNDAKCDSRGRLWSGTFSTTFERDAGSLYRIDPDLGVERAVSDIRVSNGIAWNGAETLMYFNDTLARGIDVFDYDIAQGTLSNRRRFADIERSEGLPDGMAVDAESCVWVALFFGGQVRRYSPEGRQIGVVHLPASRVTSCNFGGADLRDLYITTADFSLKDDGHAHEAQAGHVFRCRPGVQGLPSYPFG